MTNAGGVSNQFNEKALAQHVADLLMETDEPGGAR